MSCVTGWPGPRPCGRRRWPRRGAVHLERRGAEAADDEVAVAVRRAVELGLIFGTHIVAADQDAVRVRVSVQVHVFRLGERRLHGVIAGGFVVRVPVGAGGAGGDVEACRPPSSFASLIVMPAFSSLASTLPDQPEALIPPSVTAWEPSAVGLPGPPIMRPRPRPPPPAGPPGPAGAPPAGGCAKRPREQVIRHVVKTAVEMEIRRMGIPFVLACESTVAYVAQKVAGRVRANQGRRPRSQRCRRYQRTPRAPGFRFR